MKIRFLMMNAFGSGGTIRTTVDTTARLADHHDVEIISVGSNHAEPVFPHDPRVKVRLLIDTPAVRDRSLKWPTRGTRWIPGTEQYRFHTGSKLIHPYDNRWRHFSRLTDIAIQKYIRSVHDGVLIGTRSGLNLAVARLARPSVFAIGQEHLHLDLYGPNLRKSIEDYFPRLDMVTALTPTDTANWERVMGHSVPIRWMPNAVTDLGGARSTTEDKVVVAGGRLVRQKGYDRLIDAFEKVAQKHPDWHLRIYGQGELRKRLRGRITRSAAPDNMHLMGFTDQLPQKLSEGSIFALSSRFEGFGLVLIEAMGCGLPVVSFDCKHGPADIIEHDVDGLLVTNHDIDGLAAAIESLIVDPERRRKMGEAALRKSQQYSAEAVSARWEELLAEIDEMPRGERRRDDPGRLDWNDVPHNADNVPRKKLAPRKKRKRRIARQKAAKKS